MAYADLLHTFLRECIAKLKRAAYGNITEPFKKVNNPYDQGAIL